MIASPRCDAASCSARDLRQELEGPLGRAKVGEAEADVCRDHPDQRDRGKVVPLGDHLRADEQVERAGPEIVQHALDRAPPLHRVAIDAADARRSRRAASPRPRPARCRSPPAPDMAPRTSRTWSGPAPSGCSSGTPPRAGSARSPDGTVSDTLQFGQSRMCPHWRQNTVVAKPRRLSSSSDCSPAASRLPMASTRRALRMTSGPVRCVLLAHVDDLHVGERPIEHALREYRTRVSPGLGVVIRLERRRRRSRARRARRPGAHARRRRPCRDTAASLPACRTCRAPRPR